MAQIAASVATAYEIDGGRWLVQFHFERSHEGILGHHGHTVARAIDLDADSEFIISHGGLFLAAAIPMPPPYPPTHAWEGREGVRRRIAAAPAAMVT